MVVVAVEAVVKAKPSTISKRKIVRDLSKCKFCGLCSYKCPPYAIRFDPGALSVCTECGICVEVCPIKAIDPYKGEFKPSCTRCLRCLRECPVGAIYLDEGKLKIRKGPREPFIVNCSLCGLCAQNCPTGALTYDGIRIKFDPSLCNACGKCVEVCPVRTIKLKAEERTVSGWCMLCGYCVKICPTKALSIKTVSWNGEIKDTCIKCGTCASVCPTKAIEFHPLMDAKPKVDLSKCILCELCASHCPVDAIPILSTLPKRELRRKRVDIREEICVSCGLCVNACSSANKGVSAIKLIDGFPKVDEGLCTGCGACAAICPADAIRVVKVYDCDKVCGVASSVVIVP